MNQIDAGTLVLRPIHREVARILLDGWTPQGMRFAPGYPSPFSLEVMELVVGAQEQGRFRPFFMVRKADNVVVGEIGCSVDNASATGQVGYTVVEPSWGRGYATDGLRACRTRDLAARLLAGELLRIVLVFLVAVVVSGCGLEGVELQSVGRSVMAYMP
ncbi:MAG: GNAT family N-acetyltransferase [Pseudonocardiales bacterium]